MCDIDLEFGGVKKARCTSLHAENHLNIYYKALFLLIFEVTHDTNFGQQTCNAKSYILSQIGGGIKTIVSKAYY